MEDFINSLPPSRRSTVRLLLAPGLDEDRYCDSIESYLGKDYVPLYIRARQIEQARGGFERFFGDIRSIRERLDMLRERTPKEPTFLSLLTGNKLKIAKYFVTHKRLQLIRSLLTNEEERVQQAFEEWFRRQSDYEEKKPQTPIKKVTLESVLELIETEQRRTLASVLIRAKLWDLLDTVLAEESNEMRAEMQNWKKRNPSKVKNMSSRSKEATLDSGHDSSASLTNDCTESDCISDDYDSDEDPTTWTPTTMGNFIDKFPDCINILILGETGVGKSTFINGLANYLRFNNIFEAKDKVEILIKAHFSHSDQDYNQRRIECEPTIEMEHVQNENSVDGQSSTQNPRSYLISWGPPGTNKRIRIIDTPGVGDTRGVEEDKKNFTKILDYIANFKGLHAICILMKPNESKLTLTFRFCINELLSHLHASASKNILFCFTNARQTLYQPGETLPTLTAYLEKLQKDRGIQIPLNKSTLYCFDNESFRCLCAWREGVNFTKSEMDNFNLSWQTTVRETFRLFKKIASLQVHNVKETISVNNVRSMVLALTGPLAKISKNQILNLQLINDKIQEVEDCMKEGTDLDGKLVVEMVELVPQELDHPVTVCSSPSCVELKKLSNNPNAPAEVVYKDPPCHSPCALNGVQTEFCPNPALQECYIFASPDKKCKRCKCSWETHIHIRYKLEPIMRKIRDPAVEESLKKCSTKREKAKVFLADAYKKKYQLEKEAEVVNKHCVEFTTYLKQNSLMTYNDAYKEYVDNQIKEAKMVVEEGGSAEVMKKLEEHRDQYTAQIDVLDRQDSSKRPAKSAEQIYAMVDNLKKLEIAGPVLEEVQKLQLISIEKEQKEEAVAVRLEGGWMSKMLAGTTNFLTNRVVSINERVKDMLGINGKKENIKNKHKK